MHLAVSDPSGVNGLDKRSRGLLALALLQLLLALRRKGLWTQTLTDMENNTDEQISTNKQTKISERSLIREQDFHKPIKAF